MVPATAIIHEGQTTTVFVESDGKPEQRNVTIGQTVDGKVEIISGLQAGQQVAADGAELLTGGASRAMNASGQNRSSLSRDCLIAHGGMAGRRNLGGVAARYRSLSRSIASAG